VVQPPWDRHGFKVAGCALLSGVLLPSRVVVFKYHVHAYCLRMLGRVAMGVQRASLAPCSQLASAVPSACYHLSP